MTSAVHRVPLCEWWNPRTHVVYRALAADGTVLYVGVTSGLNQRFAVHEYQTPWWHLVDRVEVSQEFLDRDDAEAAEALAISTLTPVFNRHYPLFSERATPVEFAPFDYINEPNMPAVMRRIGLCS